MVILPGASRVAPTLGRVWRGGRAVVATRRRAAIALLVAALGLLGGSALQAERDRTAASPAEPLMTGFTFSRRQAEYLGLPWRNTFHAALGLSPTLVRLGAYWSEIERAPGHYDFSALDWQLDQLAERELRAILTVGMKAPRWPEYYLPDWLERELDLPGGARVSDDPRLRARTRAFIEQVVRRYRDRPTIAYWQVENEPLDPAGPHGWTVGTDFLAEEVALVRQLDDQDRPIVVNLFVETHPLVNLPPWRDEVQARARTALDLADILGLDIYPSRTVRFLGQELAFDWPGWSWERIVLDLQAVARENGKSAWVIEAQAEPWGKAQPRPSRAAETVARLRTVGFATVLLWGVEHWYWQLTHQEDDRWWTQMEGLLVSEPQAR